MCSRQLDPLFVHFFDLYGQKCGKGVAIVAGCSGITPESMSAGESTPWSPKKSSKERCISKHTRARDRSMVNERGNLTGALLQEHVDIVAGHIPIGIHNHWTDNTGSTVDAQYIGFS